MGTKTAPRQPGNKKFGPGAGLARLDGSATREMRQKEARRTKIAPTLRRLTPACCPPRGPFLPWDGPAAKSPHAAQAYACLLPPPRGPFLPWDGPAAKSPHAAQAYACLLPPPKGAIFALGRPGGKKPPRRAGSHLLAAQGGRFCRGRPGGKKHFTRSRDDMIMGKNRFVATFSENPNTSTL